MKTTPTFTIGKNEYNLVVKWPDTLGAFKCGQERLLSLITGFMTAHYVQSKFKAAMAAEKPTDAQKRLLKMVEDGEEIDGEEFIPRERGTAPKKDDAFVTEFRKRFDGFSKEKLEAFAVRWNMEIDGSEDVDDYVAAYWEDKAAQIKAAAEAAASMLD